MVRNGIGVLFVTVGCIAPSAQPGADPIAGQLASTNAEVRIEALRKLLGQRDATETLTHAVLSMMEKTGWRATEAPLACEFLAGSPARAVLALPLLTEWMVASNGSDQVVFVCAENAARAAGPAGLPNGLRAAASVANRSLRDLKGDVDAMFDTMATARRAFTRPLLEHGAAAVTALEASLQDSDPYVRAEAAGFLALMGNAARQSEPALRRALETERTPWPAHEMRAALAALRQAL
jgi:hypothetical protein